MRKLALLILVVPFLMAGQVVKRGAGLSIRSQSALESAIGVDVCVANEDCVLGNVTMDSAIFGADPGPPAFSGDQQDKSECDTFLSALTIASGDTAYCIYRESANDHGICLQDQGGSTVCTSTEIHTVSWQIHNGIATAGDELLVHTNYAITLISLDCVGTGATTPTETINVVECDANGDNCASSGLTASLTAELTTVTDDSATDAAVDANDWWGIELTTLTVESDVLHCTVEYAGNG